MEKDLLVSVLEYGVLNEVFTIGEMATFLNLDDIDKEYLWNFASTTSSMTKGPNALFQKITRDATGNDKFVWKFRLTPNAYFQYHELVELKEARETANQAKKLSWIAIWIAIGIGLLQIGTSIVSMVMSINQ